MDEAELIAFWRRHWPGNPDEIIWPGGTARKTALAKGDGRTIVISKRASPARADLEARALTALSVTGYVPGLVLRDDDFLVQDYVEGVRLTRELDQSGPERRDALLTEAGASLLAMQVAAEQAGLSRTVPEIGRRAGWMKDFASAPVHLAEQIGATRPAFDIDVIARRLEPRDSSFVKWDARPGNALLRTSGQLCWFDWEHCGRASVEDDLVWLFADEWAPISERAVARTLASAADQRGLSGDEMAHRFYIKAVVHGAIRLSLILERKGSGAWWSIEEAMDKDRVGVSLAHVRRLCQRSQDWAQRQPETRGLVPLFSALLEHCSRL